MLGSMAYRHKAEEERRGSPAPSHTPKLQYVPANGVHIAEYRTNGYAFCPQLEFRKGCCYRFTVRISSHHTVENMWLGWTNADPSELHGVRLPAEPSRLPNAIRLQASTSSVRAPRIASLLNTYERVHSKLASAAAGLPVPCAVANDRIVLWWSPINNEVYIMINRSARVCVAIGTKMAPDDKFYLLLRLPLGIDQVTYEHWFGPRAHHPDSMGTSAVKTSAMTVMSEYAMPRQPWSDLDHQMLLTGQYDSVQSISHSVHPAPYGWVNPSRGCYVVRTVNTYSVRQRFSVYPSVEEEPEERAVLPAVPVRSPPSPLPIAYSPPEAYASAQQHVYAMPSMPSTRVLNGDPAIVDLGVAQGQTVGESHEALMRSTATSTNVPDDVDSSLEQIYNRRGGVGDTAEVDVSPESPRPVRRRQTPRRVVTRPSGTSSNRRSTRKASPKSTNPSSTLPSSSNRPNPFESNSLLRRAASPVAFVKSANTAAQSVQSIAENAAAEQRRVIAEHRRLESERAAAYANHQMPSGSAPASSSHASDNAASHGLRLADSAAQLARLAAQSKAAAIEECSSDEITPEPIGADNGSSRQSDRENMLLARIERLEAALHRRVARQERLSMLDQGSAPLQPDQGRAPKSLPTPPPEDVPTLHVDLLGIHLFEDEEAPVMNPSELTPPGSTGAQDASLVVQPIDPQSSGGPSKADDWDVALASQSASPAKKECAGDCQYKALCTVCFTDKATIVSILLQFYFTLQVLVPCGHVFCAKCLSSYAAREKKLHRSTMLCMVCRRRDLRHQSIAPGAEGKCACQRECSICDNHSINTVAVPCGHLMACHTCADMCNKRVSDGKSRARCSECTEQVYRFVRIHSLEDADDAPVALVNVSN